MSYSKVITTKKGERYLQDLIISGEPLTFTKIVTSTRNYTKEDAKNLTDIENIKQTILVNEQKRFEDEKVEIEGTLSNKDVDGGYHIQTIGIYVKGDEIIPEPTYKVDEDGEIIFDDEDNPIEIEPEPTYELDEEGRPILDEEGEPIEIIPETKYESVLYGVAVAENPFYMASPHQNQITLNLKLNIYVGETENIEVITDSTKGITKKDIEHVNETLGKQISDVKEEAKITKQSLSTTNSGLLELALLTMMGGN